MQRAQRARSWPLLLIWLIAVLGAPLIFHLTLKNVQIDAMFWQRIEFRIRHRVENIFLVGWFTPLGIWFWLLGALCLLRSSPRRPIALSPHRLRDSFLRHALLAAWCLPWGIWVCLLTNAMQPLDIWLYQHGVHLPSGDPLLAHIDTQLAMALVASGLITAAVLFFITRTPHRPTPPPHSLPVSPSPTLPLSHSSWLPLAALAAAPLGAALELAPAYRYTSHAAAAAWFAIVGGAFLLWSRRSYRFFMSTVHCPLSTADFPACPACGYDLRGLGPAAPCPECGAVPTAPHSSTA